MSFFLFYNVFFFPKWDSIIIIIIITIIIIIISAGLMEQKWAQYIPDNCIAVISSQTLYKSHSGK